MSNKLTESPADLAVLVTRFACWVNFALMLCFLVNVILENTLDWPGAALFNESSTFTAWIQFLLYPFGVLVALFYIMSSRFKPLRQDAETAYRINEAFIRAAFFIVLFVGIADIVISFGRVEGLLSVWFGEEIGKGLGRPNYRGSYVHLPIMGVAILFSFFVRSLAFYWLSLLIVAAELLIVISRFVFSYEQSFMTDLVRFWYGALFLFASAYTLVEEGHVRVDVFYASFSEKTKGMVNAIGTISMGMLLCWTIIFVGMSSGRSIINAPVFNFEVTQSGFGLYIKYMMAGFLGVFAISMMIQFTGYLMSAVADWRRELGHVEHEGRAIA